MAQNNEMIQFLTDEAYNQLKLSNAELLQMVKNIDTINKGFKNAKLPSESVAQAQKAVVELEKTEKAIEKQRLAQERATKANLRNTAANQEANRSYQLLNENYNRAKKNLQDLVVRGKSAEQTQRQYNKELRDASKAFENYHQRIMQADVAVRQFQRNVGNYPQVIRGNSLLGNSFKGLATSARDLVSAFGVVGGLTAFALYARDVFQTIKQFQTLNAALLQVVGSQQQLATTQDFLASISDKYGLSLQSLTQQFTQFYVSAKDKISAQEIKNIFESISKAGASMGLSVDAQNRAFLALNQMMSKGKVQAEELRGQLGEALPGAFGIMAKAVGVTEQELDKMMEKGQLLADEVLPEFARQLEITYGIEQVQRIETLTAAQTRLGNTWDSFILALEKGDGVISSFFIKAIEGATGFLETLRDLNRTQEDNLKETYNRMFRITSEYYDQNKNISKEAVLAELSFSMQKVSSTMTEIEALKERNKQIEKAIETQGIFSRVANIAKQKDELKQNKKAIDELNVSLSSERGYYDALLKVITPTNKEKKEYNKTLKETKKLIEGTVAWYNDLIAKKIKERDETKTSTQAYKEATKEIETLQERLKNLKEGLEAISLISRGGLQFKTETPGIQAAAVALEKYKFALQDIQPLVSSAFDFGDALFEREVSRYDALINKSNEYYDNLLKNAESGSAQEIALLEEKEKAEEALQLKKREAERKQAIARKAFALAEIAINTAVGVTGALSKPATVPLVPFIIAQGALQAATVLAQPIPQYKDGTDYHKGGDAIVGDGGKHEVMVTPDGKQIITPDVPTIIKNMPKGTKVMPDANAFYQSFLLNFKQRNENTNNIEQAIERGFKKAKINNYMNLPKLDFGHQSFKNKGL